MSWENPVTTWGHAGQTVPRAGDFNRIEGNTLYLKDVAVKAVNDALNSHTAEKATEQNLGHVKVDGETITASNGVISAQTQIVDTVTEDKWVWGMENGVVFLEKVVV